MDSLNTDNLTPIPIPPPESTPIHETGTASTSPPTAPVTSRVPIHYSIPQGQDALDPLKWMSEQRQTIDTIKEDHANAQVRVVAEYNADPTGQEIPIDTYSFPGDDKKFYCIPMKYKIEVFEGANVLKTIESPSEKQSFFYTLQTADVIPPSKEKAETVTALGTLFNSVIQAEGQAILGIPTEQNVNIQPISIQAKLAKVTSSNPPPGSFERVVENVVVFRGGVKVGPYEPLTGKQLTFTNKIDRVYQNAQQQLKNLFQDYSTKTKALESLRKDEEDKNKFDKTPLTSTRSSMIDSDEDEEDESIYTDSIDETSTTETSENIDLTKMNLFNKFQNLSAIHKLANQENGLPTKEETKTYLQELNSIVSYLKNPQDSSETKKLILFFETDNTADAQSKAETLIGFIQKWL